MNPSPIVHCFDTAAQVYAEAARRFSQLAAGSRTVPNQFSVALAGGSTPAGLHRALTADYAETIAWADFRFFWGDERCVRPTDPDSNFRMANETLLAPLQIAPSQVHRLEGERADLDQAAADYEKLLRATLASNQQQVPELDLVLLGMGADAHTASLFPNTAALDEQTQLVVANRVPQLETVRLTMTFPLLHAAKRVMFLVTGSAKAAALATVLSGPPDLHRWPSQGFTGKDAVEWWIDAAAAAELP